MPTVAVLVFDIALGFIVGAGEGCKVGRVELLPCLFLAAIAMPAVEDLALDQR